VRADSRDGWRWLTVTRYRPWMKVARSRPPSNAHDQVDSWPKIRPRGGVLEGRRDLTPDGRGQAASLQMASTPAFTSSARTSA
jgi:hypothetical protein